MEHRKVRNYLFFLMLILMSACTCYKSQTSSGNSISVGSCYSNEHFNLVFFEDSVYVLTENTRNAFSYGSWSVTIDGNLRIDSRTLPFETSSSGKIDAYTISTGFIPFEGVDIYIVTNNCLKMASSRYAAEEPLLCLTSTVPNEIVDFRTHIDRMSKAPTFSPPTNEKED